MNLCVQGKLGVYDLTFSMSVT